MKSSNQKSSEGGQSNPLNPDHDENCFWMSYKDVLQKFVCLNVCKAVNMHEIRLKGKFMRIQDIEDPSVEVVQSKWYYSIEAQFRTKVVIGIH